MFIEISTVTPVFRGKNTLRNLVVELEKLKNECESGNYPFRITESIFVDDGSTDGSDLELISIQNEYSWIHVVHLSKNFGQHPATMAGILNSSGDWVATLDEDLQHHPKFLLSLLRNAVMESNDVVYAHPTESVHASIVRDMGSRSIKWAMTLLSGNRNVRFFNSFRLIRGSVARATASVAMNQTYFDMALFSFTSRVGVINLPLKDERYINEKSSGYSFRSLLSHARRLLQSADLKITRLGAILGFIAMIIALIVSVYTVYIRLFIPEVAETSGWASIMVSVLFLGGLSSFLLGLILENLSIILMQNHGKPTFFQVDRSIDVQLKEWFNSK